MREIRIRLLWHKQAQFAGYLMAEALGFGREKGISIVCERPDFARSPVEAVRLGAVEAAVASPAHVLECSAPEEVTLILVIQQASPLVYPVRATSSVRTLADLAGRPIAVWPGNESLELRWMLLQAGVAEADFIRVETTDTLAALLEGRAEAAQMTCYHELRLAQEALGKHGLRIFRPAEGQGLVKDGLVVSRAMAEAEPDIVQALVDASLKGWTAALEDPESAVAICCAARCDTKTDEQKSQLSDISELALQGATVVHGLGYPNPQHEQRARLALAAVGHGALDPRPITTLDFWEAAPASLRRRSFP
jgi:NitT/TauT family transport system substrate-binding protein